MTSTLIRRVLLVVFIVCSAFPLMSQERKRSLSLPNIHVENYVIQATLKPESHEIKATAEMTLIPMEATDAATFEISENLVIQKVLDSQGIELEFAQNENGVGFFTVRFRSALPPGQKVTIKVEYSGGFDRDRFSRMYMRDESSAYIGMEGSYLLYSAKWFPIGRIMTDRATATLSVTVPLGTLVIGPGEQTTVATKGINETFGWVADRPILTNSIIAGQYFEKKIQAGDLSITCYTGQDKLASAENSANELAKIIDYYQKTFGPSAAGNNFRLVEVDDRLNAQSGMLGAIYITRRELAMAKPAVRELARRAAYQWWLDSVGVQGTEDLWLVDGLAYYSAAMYMAQSKASTLKDETDILAVLGLKFESRSPVSDGFSLGYKTEPYESVVGGKGAWIVHMLREIVGEAKFTQLLQQYAKSYSGKNGSTAEFRALAEQIHGKELAWFFGQWLDTTGVPNLTTDSVTYRTATGFKVIGSISQERDFFRLPIEIQIVTKENKTETKLVQLDAKSSPFEIETTTMPARIVLDPNNKVLRDSKELQTRVQISLGNDLKEKENFVEAIRAYEKALKLNPYKSLAHFRMAEVFFEQMNLNASANSFRDALNGDKDPKWLEVWCYIYIGKINDILGQRQRALAEYNKAVNTKDDTDGAQAEAQKWISKPYTRELSTVGKETTH